MLRGIKAPMPGEPRAPAGTALVGWALVNAALATRGSEGKGLDSSAAARGVAPGRDRRGTLRVSERAASS